VTLLDEEPEVVAGVLDKLGFVPVPVVFLEPPHPALTARPTVSRIDVAIRTAGARFFITPPHMR
jgi:hypothetical protein